MLLRWIAACTNFIKRRPFISQVITAGVWINYLYTCFTVLKLFAIVHSDSISRKHKEVIMLLVMAFYSRSGGGYFAITIHVCLNSCIC